MRISSLLIISLLTGPGAFAQVVAGAPGPATGEGNYSQPLAVPGSPGAINVPTNWQTAAETYGPAAAAQNAAAIQATQYQQALAAQQAAAAGGALNFQIQAPTQTANTSGSGMSGMMSMLPALMNCPLFTGSGGDAMGSTPGNSDRISELSRGIMADRDKKGFQYEQGTNKTDAEFFGHEYAARYGGSCKQNFINEKGQLGGWGAQALAEIKQDPKAFAENEPPDVKAMCPGYLKMPQQKKELFWVWAIASLASSESSCKPTAKNFSAPNTRTVGPATGLFQIDNQVCAPYSGGGSLTDPHNNIHCAIKLLGVELKRRDNLTSPTSKGGDSRRTYWGPLRNDDNNKRRGGDIAGAKKFRSLLKQFSGCQWKEAEFQMPTDAEILSMISALGW